MKSRIFASFGPAVLLGFIGLAGSVQCALAAVGRTAGSYSVSATGAANYSIPLWTPPGINGIQPSLALVYSSRGNDGYYGMGWNLAGLSAIARCPKTWAQDGAPRNVRNDAADRFCLDGNQLKLTGGTYGVAGSTYQTELETFSRITAAGVDGNGPASFTVEAKNGLIYEYGNTADSRIESVAQSTARAWAVNTIRDRAGNAMNFTYTEDATNGGFRIASIAYTSNSSAGISPLYSVSFIYETVPVGEIDSAYLAGAPVKRITRTDRIDVLQGATVVRRYELTYEGSLSSTSKSRLASVQECGLTLTDCLSSTTFTYQNGTAGLAAEVNTGSAVPAGATPWPLDVNGDGRKDLVYPSSTVSGSGTWMVMFANSAGAYSAPTNTGITNTNWSGATPIDYNADGLEDLLVPYSGGTWWVLLGNASGFASPVNTGIATTATGSGTNARALDIDGDGYQDLVWADLVGYAGGDSIKYRLRVPAGTFSATVNTLYGPLSADAMITSGVFGPAGQTGSSRAPDFNGDGREDLLLFRTVRVWTGVKYNFQYAVVTVGADGQLFSASVSGPFTPYFGDFNGDGRSDLLYATNSAFQIRYSTGTSFTAAVSGPSTASYGAARLNILDWDGDGYEDLLAPNASTGQWDVIRSTGEAIAGAVGTGLASGGDATVTDLDGDALPDLGYTAAGVWKYRSHAGIYPDLLLSATDGFGMAASFAYVPITQNNYSKYADAVYPEQDYQKPLYVVSTLTAPTGIQSPATYTQSFWYYGARLQLQGRGFEGFYAQRVNDNRNGLYVYSYFLRAFPYSGALFQSDVYQSNASTLIQHSYSAFSLLTLGSGYETRYFPYASSGVSDVYEFGGTLNAQLITHTMSSVGAIDSYGNPTSATVATTDSSPSSPYYGEVYSTVTTNTITNDTANWCLGRATQTTVQNILPNSSSQTRTQGATIDYAKCRVTQSVLEPGSTTLSVTTNFGFDTTGNVNSVELIGRNPDGTAMASRTTTASFGANRIFPETVTNALGQSSAVGYLYSLGVRSSVTDPNGLVTTWLYDDYGRPARETRPDNTYTGWSFSPCNAGNGYCGVGDLRYALTETRYSNTGAAIRSAYLYHDAFDRLRYNEQQNLAGGLTNIVTTYDALGRRSEQYQPYSSVLNGRTVWNYDTVGRVTAQQLFTSAGVLDRQTTMAYAGRARTITDPKGNVRTKYVDVRGQLRRIVDPSPGGTMNYGFDAFGNLTSATDPASNVQSWAYNLRGFVTGSTDPDRGTWSYSPNSLGEVVSQTDAKSQTVTMAFDALARPLSRTESEGVSTWTWGTSAAAKNIGQLQSVAGPGYSESYAFDSLGRPSITTYNADVSYQVDFAYDATTGMLDNLTYPVSTSSYRLRAQYLYQYGILKQVRDYNAPSTVWWQLNAMDDLGNPIDEQLGNGVHIIASNDSLTGHLNWRSSGTNGSFNNHQNVSYNWDKNENLTDRIDANQANLTEHFVYDGLDRLDYSTLNGVTNLDVTLDAIGNITYRSDVGNYTYHATRKHAVASTSNGWSFSYDNNGNMLTGRGQTLTWMSYNLPASVTNGALTSSFSYTPSRQYWKQVANYSNGPETTIYVGGLLEKVTGASVTEYRHRISAGTATVIVTRSTGSNNNTYYTSSDSLGSANTITNSAAAVMINESFAAYGARRGSAWTGAPSSGDWSAIGSTTRRGYTGHTMLDNLSLIHMNGRTYDPSIGRFVSADPSVDGDDTTQGWNRYSYVKNNPLGATDPSGFTSNDRPGARPRDGGLGGDSLDALEISRSAGWLRWSGEANLGESVWAASAGSGMSSRMEQSLVAQYVTTIANTGVYRSIGSSLANAFGDYLQSQSGARAFGSALAAVAQRNQINAMFAAYSSPGMSAQGGGLEYYLAQGPLLACNGCVPMGDPGERAAAAASAFMTDPNVSATTKRNVAIAGGIVILGGTAYFLVPEIGTLSASGGAARSIAPQVAKIEKQLAQYGRSSVERSLRSLETRLAEHRSALDTYRAQGGYTSSVEREIRAFEREIQAIRDVLGRGP